MSNESNARTAVNEYLSSRQHELNTDPTITLRKFHARVVLPFTTKTDPRNKQLLIEIGEISHEMLDELILNSKYDWRSWQACKLIEEDDTFPYEIRYKISKAIKKEPKKTGRDPFKDYFRNFIIALAVFRAKSEGLPEFSKGNNTKITACRVVSEELEKFNIFRSSGAIEKIWLKYRGKYK
jgi:hypothetical protein